MSYENDTLGRPAVATEKRVLLSAVWTVMVSCRFGVLSYNSWICVVNAKTTDKFGT